MAIIPLSAQARSVIRRDDRLGITAALHILARMASHQRRIHPIKHLAVVIRVRWPHPLVFTGSPDVLSYAYIALPVLVQVARSVFCVWSRVMTPQVVIRASQLYSSWRT